MDFSGWFQSTTNSTQAQQSFEKNPEAAEERPVANDTSKFLFLSFFFKWEKVYFYIYPQVS